MSNNWEDDLLNFDYSNPAPGERPSAAPDITLANTPSEIEDAIKAEEERARRLQDEYEKIRAASRAQREQPVEIPRRAEYSPISETPVAPADTSSIKVDRKSSRKASKKASKAGKAAAKNVSGFYKFTRFLSIPYVLFLAAFVAVMTIMNILPFTWWVAMLVVLGLLSIIIVAQLRKFNIKKWAKVLSTVMAVVLIFVYGAGSVYGLGTLSFLSTNSVKNDNKVAKITKEPFNVCMTGIDTVGTIDTQGRSDVNMVVTVNPETETILMTSIPRDYEVRMPDYDYATDKLTHTGFYGVDITMHAEEDLLQTKLNYYVKVNFSTVKAFIYAIGGIDVYSDYEFNPVKKPEWTVKQGWNHMDGKQALAFARERKAFEDGDRQRIKNQQAVLEAMIKKGTSSKTMILNYNKIVSHLSYNFEMSISSSEIRSLIKLQLAKNPDWKIYKNTITGGDGHMGTYSTGSTQVYVMTQDAESIAHAQELINAVLSGQKLTENEDGEVSVVQETVDEDKGNS